MVLLPPVERLGALPLHAQRAVLAGHDVAWLAAVGQLERDGAVGIVHEQEPPPLGRPVARVLGDGQELLQHARALGGLFRHVAAADLERNHLLAPELELVLHALRDGPPPRLEQALRQLLALHDEGPPLPVVRGHQDESVPRLQSLLHEKLEGRIALLRHAARQPLERLGLLLRYDPDGLVEAGLLVPEIDCLAREEAVVHADLVLGGLDATALLAHRRLGHPALHGAVQVQELLLGNVLGDVLERLPA
mmetsp:Transcript_304/g.718  ORF Transcript_304/g.718 Transcript_304/m.718 type:complete len:249 (-) Transcript_304:539-1285(-)